MRTKINHVTVVTMDGQFHVYENGYVVLDGKTILETGEGDGPADVDETVNGKNGILMPGMINTCLLYTSGFRGRAGRVHAGA